MTDTLPPSQYWLRIAALQKGGKVLVVDTHSMPQPQARNLFRVLKENGTGMQAELWSETFNKKIDEFTHKNYPIR